MGWLFFAGVAFGTAIERGWPSGYWEWWQWALFGCANLVMCFWSTHRSAQLADQSGSTRDDLPSILSLDARLIMERTFKQTPFGMIETTTMSTPKDLGDRANDSCRRGVHADPDNSGMCIYCAVILDPEPGEDPNDYRRSKGWPDVPVETL